MASAGEDRQPSHRLVTVTCSEGEHVHLAFRGSDGSLARHTLCGLPVRAPQAAGAFLALGCRDCAELAGEGGLTLAVDDDGAAVSIAGALPGSA